MNNDTMVKAEQLFGHHEMKPAEWVPNGKGGIGQKYEWITYDENGVEISRKKTDPVCYLYLGGSEPSDSYYFPPYWILAVLGITGAAFAYWLL
jgi:hypothetical protein